MRKIICFFIIFMIFIFVLSCKGKVSGDILIQTNTVPVVDGVIDDSEYRVTIPTDKMTLSLSRSSETLGFGLSGKTMGWTSIGFGAMGMDKAHIIMGYAIPGDMVFVEQTGIGHRHEKSTKNILSQGIVIDKDGMSTFEGTIGIRDVIEEGQTELLIIIACGEKDSFSSRHIFRKSIAVKLAEK